MRTFEGYQRGVNLGGWLSQRDETTKEYYDTFITETDFQQISNAGLDHVRIPVDYMMLETEDAAPIAAGYEYLDKAVEWAKKWNLNVIIDLHKTYGYSFDPLDCGMDREIFFHDRDLQERFFRLWERIALRYAGDTDRVAFELLNEIVSENVAEDWNLIADEAVRRIRRIAPEAYIVIGGVIYNAVSSVPLLHPPLDDHIVYNFHCYEPILFTHQKAYWVENMPKDRTVHYPGTLEEYCNDEILLARDLTCAIRDGSVKALGTDFFEKLFAPAIDAAQRRNAPLYCGEYGVIDQAPAEDALRWFTDIHAVFEKHGIGRAMWNYRRKDFGLVDAHYDGVREQLVKVL